MANYDRSSRLKYFNGSIDDQIAEHRQLTGKALRTVHGKLRTGRQLADHCRKFQTHSTETELRRSNLYLRNQTESACENLRVARLSS
jgi:hypothetical protein